MRFSSLFTLSGARLKIWRDTLPWGFDSLVAWMEVIAKAKPELFSRAGLQYLQALPLEHLLPFAQFLAAAEGVD